MGVHWKTNNIGRRQLRDSDTGALVADTHYDPNTGLIEHVDASGRILDHYFEGSEEDLRIRKGM